MYCFKQRTDPPPAPPGGEKVVNVTDPRVIKASMAGIEAINLQNGYGETALREVISKVKNATEQVCHQFYTDTFCFFNHDTCSSFMIVTKIFHDTLVYLQDHNHTDQIWGFKIISLATMLSV